MTRKTKSHDLHALKKEEVIIKYLSSYSPGKQSSHKKETLYLFPMIALGWLLLVSLSESD